MTKNSFSKSATRARMEETGEPYSVAARALAEDSSVPLATNFRRSAQEGPVADYGALIVFCERLALFYEMGHTIIRGLRLAAPHTEDRVLREAVEFIVGTHDAEVRDGQELTDLAALMELRPRAFRGVFPDFIRTASSGGFMAMSSMAKLYRTELEMEERAARYR